MPFLFSARNPWFKTQYGLMEVVCFPHTIRNYLHRIILTSSWSLREKQRLALYPQSFIHLWFRSTLYILCSVHDTSSVFCTSSVNRAFVRVPQSENRPNIRKTSRNKQLYLRISIRCVNRPSDAVARSLPGNHKQRHWLSTGTHRTPTAWQRVSR
jgi:hypothetical protein